MEQPRGHRLVLRQWSNGYRILIVGKTHWRSSYDTLFACQPTYCLLQRAERSGVGGGHPRGRSVSADLLPGCSRICARNERSEYAAKHSKPVGHGDSVWVSGFVFRDLRQRVQLLTTFQSKKSDTIFRSLRLGAPSARSVTASCRRSRRGLGPLRG